MFFFYIINIAYNILLKMVLKVRNQKKNEEASIAQSKIEIPQITILFQALTTDNPFVVGSSKR